MRACVRVCVRACVRVCVCVCRWVRAESRMAGWYTDLGGWVVGGWGEGSEYMQIHIIFFWE